MPARFQFLQSAERALVERVKERFGVEPPSILTPTIELPYARPGRDSEARYRAPARVLFSTSLTSGTDNVRVVVACSVAQTLTLTGLIRTNSGQLAGLGPGGSGFILPPIAGDRVVRSFDVGISAHSELVDLTLSTTMGSTAGLCYAILQTIRTLPDGSTVVTGTRTADYLTATRPLSWPGGIIRSSLDAIGFVRAITGTDPAAGVQISEAVPTNTRWELLSVQFNLSTSATAATRQMLLLMFSGGIGYDVAASFSQTASLTFIYTWFPGANAFQDAADGLMQSGLPAAPRFTGSWGTSAFQFQATDNLTAPNYSVAELLIV